MSLARPASRRSVTRNGLARPVKPLRTHEGSLRRDVERGSDGGSARRAAGRLDSARQPREGMAEVSRHEPGIPTIRRRGRIAPGIRMDRCGKERRNGDVAAPRASRSRAREAVPVNILGRYLGRPTPMQEPPKFVGEGVDLASGPVRHVITATRRRGSWREDARGQERHHRPGMETQCSCFGTKPHEPPRPEFHAPPPARSTALDPRTSWMSLDVILNDEMTCPQ